MSSEYDDLFASAIKRSANVVLGGYFRSFPADSNHASISQEELPYRFTISTDGPFETRRGTQLNIPIKPLLESAAGFGHTNLTSELDFPLMIGTGGDRYVLAFLTLY